MYFRFFFNNIRRWALLVSSPSFFRGSQRMSFEREVKLALFTLVGLQQRNFKFRGVQRLVKGSPHIEGNSDMEG